MVVIDGQPSKNIQKQIADNLSHIQQNNSHQYNHQASIKLSRYKVHSLEILNLNYNQSSINKMMDDNE